MGLKKLCGNWCSWSILLIISWFSFAHALFLCTFLAYSFFVVNDKPIFGADIFLFPITSAMIHYIKIDRGEHHGLFFNLATAFSILSFVLLFLTTFRNHPRNEASVYASTGVKVGFDMTYIRNDLELLTTLNWLDARDAALCITTALEAGSIIISLFLCMRIHPKKTEKDNKKKNCIQTLWNRVKTGEKVKKQSYIVRVCCDSTSESKDKSIERFMFVCICTVVLLAMLVALPVRLILAFFTFYYDLPYWTEQETPSGLFYCTVLLYFGHLITKPGKVEEYNEEETTISRKKKQLKEETLVLNMAKTLTSQEEIDRQDKEIKKREKANAKKKRSIRQRSIGTAWFLILMLPVAGTIMFISSTNNRELLYRRDISYLNLGDYLGGLQDGLDMGGYHYEFTSASTNAPRVFGKMTYVSHTIDVMEQILVIALWIATCVWVCVYGQNDKKVAQDDSTEV